VPCGPEEQAASGVTGSACRSGIGRRSRGASVDVLIRVQSRVLRVPNLDCRI
jgi:hypothetical protein